MNPFIIFLSLLYISELLKGYQKHNYHYPDNIFVFRDGVSETQLEQVKEKEIPLIWAAI